jgi:CDP-diacylglycerol--serine O-phosphatidyltransferase
MENLGFTRQLSQLFGRGIIFSAIFYAMCAVVRLARFNVENEEDESAHMAFAGLPSPAAAGVVASLIVLHQYFFLRFGNEASSLYFYDVMTVSVLPAVTLLSGILMVTRIRYPHLANQIFRGKKSLPVFLALFTTALFSVWNIQLVLALGFCGFAVFGVVRWIVTKLFRKPRPDTA